MRLAAAFLLLTTATANAATPIPKRYDHPYKGKLYTVWTTPENVHRVCGNPRAMGCAFGVIRKRECLIVMIGGLNREWSSYLFRHERAHCNGWKATHPF